MSEVISIIMPLYNSEKYIDYTIESILNQTYTNWRLYIIDDCSEDKSVDIVNKFLKKDKRISLIQNDSNLGQAYSRNRGIEQCEGEYIVFIDSDDLWYNNFLERQLSFINSKNCNVVFSSFDRYDEELNKSYGRLKIPESVTYKDLLLDNSLSCLTTMYNCKNIGKLYFNTQYKHEDHIYWIDLLKLSNETAYGNDESLAIYRIRKSSESRNKIKAAIWKWKIYRNYLKFNLLKCSYYYINYIYRGIMKNKKFIIVK